MLVFLDPEIPSDDSWSVFLCGGGKRLLATVRRSPRSPQAPRLSSRRDGSHLHHLLRCCSPLLLHLESRLRRLHRPPRAQGHRQRRAVQPRGPCCAPQGNHAAPRMIIGVSSCPGLGVTNIGFPPLHCTSGQPGKCVHGCACWRQTQKPAFAT